MQRQQLSDLTGGTKGIQVHPQQRHIEAVRIFIRDEHSFGKCSRAAVVAAAR